MQWMFKAVLLVWTVMGLLGSCAWAETYTDVLGRTITLDAPPQRIIPLAPNLTETLYFLGLGPRVVGVTTYSNYPPEAALKPKVGSYINLNVEKIISLAPDLVIGTVDGNRPSLIDLLEQAGIQAFIVNPRDVKAVFETIETIGRVCGVSQEAERLALELRRRVEHVEAKVQTNPKTRVFMQINLKPIMTVNHNTFLDDMIRLAGGQNIFEDEPGNYPRINIEEVIRRQPEVIIIPVMAIDGEFKEARLDWFKWDSIPAARDGRVHLIESDLTNRPSPRIVDGLEKMARLIHPEISWK